MKKMFSVLLCVLLLLTAQPAAFAEEPSVYDALMSFVDGREFSLTVRAETEAEGRLADMLSAYGTIRATLRQEGDELLLHAACEGDAYLKLTANAETVSFETNLLENGRQSYAWSALEPSVILDGERFEVSMTGPDHELIRFSFEISAESAEEYDLEIQIGYITGPGNVHSLWDGVGCHGGESSREFYFSFSEEEYAVEGDGVEILNRAADGGLTITRDDEYTVTYLDDELGNVSVHTVLEVK